jgi:hypothetical protein
VIGDVQSTFLSTKWSPFGITVISKGVQGDAYVALLGEAQKYAQEGKSIDVRNIVVAYSSATYNWEPVSYTAKGDVVVLGAGETAAPVEDVLAQAPAKASKKAPAKAPKKTVNKDPAPPKPTSPIGIEGALARASEQVLKNVPGKSKIAIVYITAQDKSTTEYVVGELEYIWVNAGYFITDRSQLDKLRTEQKFGMSGEVDDATAVSIGKFAGAGIIVTGTVDGDGDLRRLRLRALNTSTAQVIGVASERL